MAPREIEIVYLELRNPPRGEEPEPPRADLEIRRIERPGAPLYRELYAAVGGPWQWWERAELSDGALLAIIQDPAVEIWTLEIAGVVAGYVELDRRIPGEVEIAYFGLLPRFIGLGLGRYFCAWAVRRAFAKPTHRLWLHTCNLDHPRALSTYRAAGFEEVERVRRVVQIPGR